MHILEYVMKENWESLSLYFLKYKWGNFRIISIISRVVEKRYSHNNFENYFIFLKDKTTMNSKEYFMIGDGQRSENKYNNNKKTKKEMQKG